MASIEKKIGKNGNSYRVRYRANNKDKAKSFKKLKDARTFKSRIEHELSSNEYYEYPNLKLSQLLDQWLKAHAPRVREITTDNYTTAVKSINKYIGHIPIDKLTAVDIEDMYFTYKKGRSPRSVYALHQVMSIAFKYAFKARLIKLNPMLLVTPPKQQKANVNTIAFVDIHKYLDCVKGYWIYPVVCLYTFLGMRRGEIYALKWDHVNFFKKTIHIEFTETTINGKHIISPPKNGEERHIPLPPAIASMLREHKKWQDTQYRQLLEHGYKPQGINYVITKEDIERPLPRSMGQAFARKQKYAGLEHVSLHSLKHTASTLMGYSGMDKKIASTILAHKSVEFTDDIYRYVFDEQMKAASDALNDTIIQNFKL